MELIDTHAHLDEQAFEQELDAVVDRAREAGLVGIITIGITVESSRNAIVSPSSCERSGSRSHGATPTSCGSRHAVPQLMSSRR